MQRGFVRAWRREERYQAPMASFETNITIRFEDADPAGIVFYPRAIALAHGVIEDLIRQTELGWHGWFENHGLAAPVRHAEADFFAPMRAGETLKARAWVEKIGETSGTFAVELLGSEGEMRARIRTVHVLVDRNTKQPVALTPEVRRALEQFVA
jgi:YbgC/YbaW family acyl-CoA thioester hydrolase